MGPHPAVAAIRLAVRRVLHDILNDQTRTNAVGASATHPVVLAACSGGADSMALASALAFEARKLGVRAGGVTIDHGLQAGSAARAVDVVHRLRGLGLDPVEARGVTVGRQGGPEAAAREARYAALEACATSLGAVAVMLGHTRDDQAETVLLGLARGSGTRSLAGMPAIFGPGGRYRRPFLLLDRDTTRKACLVQGIDVWEDPHNADPAYTRARVRHEALPVLEKSLGRGVVASLARTAQLFRDDAEALDQWATTAARDVIADDEPDGRPGGALDTAKLYTLPPAVRRRVLRMTAVEAGSPSGSLFARHVEEMDRLVTGWRGQGPINLPGGVEARRRNGKLVIQRAIASE